MVNCDSSHIRQIVGNLLSNALKFTFHGKVLLEVEYRPEISTFLSWIRVWE